MQKQRMVGGLLLLALVASACRGNSPEPQGGPTDPLGGGQEPTDAGVCLPSTCAALQKNCGEISDGCGGTLACGDCGAGESCGLGGVPNVCAASARAPAAPTGVQATAGAHSAFVSWQPPADPGTAPVLRFTVKASPGGTEISVDGADATQALVAGLSPAESYTFTVRATNAVGDGQWSAPSSSVTPTDEACDESMPLLTLCLDLMPASASPVTQDIDAGYSYKCDRQPAVDGEGNIVYGLTWLQGSHRGASTFRVEKATQETRGEFEVNPLPNLWPQASGFQLVSYACAGAEAGYTVEQYDPAGNKVANTPLGNFPCDMPLSSRPDPAGGTVVAWQQTVTPAAGGAAVTELRVQRFDGTGAPRFAQPALVASWPPPASGSGFAVVGTDVDNNTLVLFNADVLQKPGKTAGRWLDKDGVPLGDVFETSVPPLVDIARREPGGVLAPKAGGGLALQVAGAWRYQFSKGATAAAQAPCWLYRRPGTRLSLAKGGRANALLPPERVDPAACEEKIELFGAQGQRCVEMSFDTSALSCTTNGLELGYDGTVIARLPPRVPPAPNAEACTLRWWPKLLQ